MTVKQLWKKCFAPDKTPYYYNTVTKVSQWNRPSDYKSSKHQVWHKCKSSDNETYYYNSKTHESVWKKPKDYVEERKSSSKTESNKSEQKIKKSSPDTKKLNSNPIDSTQERIKIRKFKNLLIESNIQPNSVWSKVSSKIKNDHRFKLLPNRDMIKIFEEFKAKKLQDEKLNDTKLIEQKCKFLQEFLLKDTRMTSAMSYEEADEVFEQDEPWCNLEDSDRRKIFHKVLPNIFSKEVKRMKDAKDHNINKLKKLFEINPLINYQTTWAEAQQYLLENEEFINDSDIQNMDKEDALNLFQAHIKKLESIHKEELDLVSRARELYYAENRQKFIKLLKNLHKTRILTDNSTWKQIYPHIKDSLEFLEMIASPGSSPLDIFKFFIRDIQYNYTEDVAALKTVLKDYGYEITMKTSYDNFYKFVKSVRDLSHVRKANVAYFYDVVMSRLKHTKKVSEPVTPYERKRQNFKKLLFKLGRGVITAECKYSDIMKHILDSKEYKDFADETEKYRIFKKMKRHFYKYDKAEKVRSSQDFFSTSDSDQDSDSS